MEDYSSFKRKANETCRDRDEPEDLTSNWRAILQDFMYLSYFKSSEFKTKWEDKGDSQELEGIDESGYSTGTEGPWCRKTTLCVSASWDVCVISLTVHLKWSQCPMSFYHHANHFKRTWLKQNHCWFVPRLFPESERKHFCDSQEEN